MEKLLGFGCMRLPMKDDEVDYEEFKKMIDYYMSNGFNYFDTAHGYLSGQSEIAIRECLTKRYKREEYILTDKLSKPFFDKESEIRPFFESQLKACGVDYFDYYLMHAQDREVYYHFLKTNAYEVAKKLKEEGKIKHLGISFHDTSDLLEKILKDHPEIEVVQIQFNYVDFKSPNVQSEKLYKLCEKYKKKVLIMEPVKGGGLVNLPEDAKKVFDSLNDGKNSYASYALRFAGGFKSVYKVLSGMSNLKQLKDNVKTMKNFKTLNEEENAAIIKVRKIISKLNSIPCTACRYCVDGCPKNISIPDLFACYNNKKQFHDWNANYYYSIHTKFKGKAKDCIKCGQCENICPQHLKIRELLEKVSEEFDK